MIVTNKHNPRLLDGQLNKTGQHSVYLALSEEERSRGFVRPLRRTYIHVGTRIRRDEEGRLFGKLILIDDPEYPKSEYYTKENGYSGFIRYPKSEAPLTGRYITEGELEAIIARKTHFGGCGSSTTMGPALAETYAVNPKFYGSTFCCGCNIHIPVEQFVWEDDTIVGS